MKQFLLSHLKLALAMFLTVLVFYFAFDKKPELNHFCYYFPAPHIQVELSKGTFSYIEIYGEEDLRFIGKGKLAHINLKSKVIEKVSVIKEKTYLNPKFLEQGWKSTSCKNVGDNFMI